MSETKNKVYLLKDTMEVFANDIDGGSYYFGLTTEGAVRKSISQDLIRAGLHNKVVGVLSTDEEWSVEVTTGLHYKDLAEIQLGADFRSESVTIQEITEDAAGNVTVTPKPTSAGSIIDLEPDRFGKVLEDVQLHTIAYDPDTNKVVADIYWIFYSTLPDGNFEQVLGAGANNIQTLTLTPRIAPGKTSYGVYAIIPREDVESGYGTIVVHGVKSDGQGTLYIDVLTKRLGKHMVVAKTVEDYPLVDKEHEEVTLATNGQNEMVVFTYSIQS